MASPKTIKTALKIMKKYAESPIMIQDAWHNKAEPLIIPADLKMSYPVSLDPKTGKFVEDAKGMHRWSHLKSVTL
jgi:hypothetical protein